jgi:hypothetical protein
MMARGMLQSRYYTEHDLADFGFKSLGRNIMISSDARVYGAHNISIGNNVRIDDFTILAAVNGSTSATMSSLPGIHISAARSASSCTTFPAWPPTP